MANPRDPVFIIEVGIPHVPPPLVGADPPPPVPAAPAPPVVPPPPPQPQPPAPVPRKPIDWDSVISGAVWFVAFAALAAVIALKVFYWRN